jgi:hypothetical protein
VRGHVADSNPRSCEARDFRVKNAATCEWLTGGGLLGVKKCFAIFSGRFLIFLENPAPTNHEPTLKIRFVGVAGQPPL